MNDFNFSYQCNKCGEIADSHSMSSFTCECDGTFKLLRGTNFDVLESYYDETLKMRITSAAQRNREFRKAGLYISQDDSKMINRWKDFRKHKEEIHQELMAKEGKWYKPGSKSEWSDEKQDFISTSTRKYF